MERIEPSRLKRYASPFPASFGLLATSAVRRGESDGHFAYVQSDCRPTDGLALHLYFTEKQIEAAKYQEPFLDIAMNENLPKSAPQDDSIMPGSAAVFASRCSAPGHCVGATSSTLHLTKFDGSSSVSGEYKLSFHDRSVENGSFEATLRSTPARERSVAQTKLPAEPEHDSR
jgi:hypothetical protein